MRHETEICKKHSPKTPKLREEMEKIPYALAVGYIISIMICSRLDVACLLRVMRKF